MINTIIHYALLLGLGAVIGFLAMQIGGESEKSSGRPNLFRRLQLAGRIIGNRGGQVFVVSEDFVAVSIHDPKFAEYVVHHVGELIKETDIQRLKKNYTPSTTEDPAWKIKQ